MKMRTKIFSLFCAIVFSFLLANLGVPSAKALTVEELQAKIQQLLQQVTELQKQLQAAQAESTMLPIKTQPETWCHTFDTNLELGDRGSEVTALQTALQKQGLSASITGLFDAKTEAAVIAFQEKYTAEILSSYGLKQGTGFVGKTTRAKLNALYGCAASASSPSTPTTPTPASGEVIVPVLVLKYFPLDETQANIDFEITQRRDTLENIRSWTTTNTNEFVQTLTEGTKYHGYKDSSAKAALEYRILETKEFLKPTPRRFWEMWFSDYQKMLTEDVDICDYVENKGVKDVWIWSYQTDQNGILESNMSMGRISNDFWKFGTYGDVSNDHYKRNDLPQCNKTYVVYNFNYDAGGLGNMMHDYMHQIENEMGFASREIFWDMYTGKQGGFAGPRRCGNAHAPPNLDAEYNYSLKTYVKSDCENWQPVNCISISDINADCGGVRENINCDKWGCTDTGFYSWWMQNLPGPNNNLTYQGVKLRNWWDFMGDFDAAIANGQTLLANGVLMPSITVLAPNGGEVWVAAGQTYNISWISANVGRVYITLVDDKLNASCKITKSSIVNTGILFSVNIGQVCGVDFTGNKMKIQVSADVNTTNGIEVRDTSNNYFSIVKEAGSLSFALSSNSPPSQDMLIGNIQQPFLKVKFAADLVEDIKINSIRIAAYKQIDRMLKSAAATDIDNIALYDGDTRITLYKGISSASEADTFVSEADTFVSEAVTFISDDFIKIDGLQIPKGASRTITVKADIPSTNKSETLMVIIAGVNAVGVTSGAYIPATGSATGALMNITHGSLSVSLDSSTPVGTGSIAAGTTNVAFTKFTLIADKEDLKITSVYLTKGSESTVPDSALQNIRLFDGSTQIGSAASSMVNGKALISNMNLTIAKGASKTITAKADISSLLSMDSVAALRISSAADISAVGATSGTKATVNGSFPVEGDYFSFIAPFVCTACAADIKKDFRNRVDSGDAALYNSCFGQSATGSCATADVNGDGVINSLDNDCIQAQYLQTCAVADASLQEMQNQLASIMEAFSQILKKAREFIKQR